MTLRQSARWRGVAGVVLLVLSVPYVLITVAKPENSGVALVAGVLLIGAAFLLRSWSKLRRRIQELDYQARAFAETASRAR